MSVPSSSVPDNPSAVQGTSPEASVIPPAAMRAGIGTGLVFMSSGMMFGTWASRIPAIRDAVDASAGELGRALLFMAVGSLVSMPFTGRVVSRTGSRVVIIVMVSLAAISLAYLSTASSVMALSIGLFFYGLGFGSWDVAMNVHGHTVEHIAGRPWMPRYHGAWSVGGMLGAAMGAFAAGANVSLPVHFGVGILVVLAIVGASLTTWINDRQSAINPTAHAAPSLDQPVSPESSAAEVGSEPLIGTGAAVANASTDHKSAKGRTLTGAVLALGALTLCGTVVEGVANDWLALLLVDEMGVGQGSAGWAFTTFATAMAITRFAGPQLIDRWGRVGALRRAGLVSLIGVVTTLFAPGMAVALLGAAFWGVGVALVFPAAMSAAGDGAKDSAKAIAAVSTIGYAGFLIGPPVIGYLAEQTGLATALWACALAAVGVVALSPFAAEKHAGPGERALGGSGPEDQHGAQTATGRPGLE